MHHSTEHTHPSFTPLGASQLPALPRDWETYQPHITAFHRRNAEAWGEAASVSTT